MIYLKPFRGPTDLRFYTFEGSFNLFEPVHELLTLAALYQVKDKLGIPSSKFGNKVTGYWSSPEINEFLRGVLWNDDPAVLLFDKNPGSDEDFDDGSDWKDKFDTAKTANTPDLKNLTGRSHFGDMQFLHGMACMSNESPALTRYRVMMWSELMYKLSIGEPVSASGTPSGSGNTLIKDVRIPANPSQYDPHITEQFSQYFSAETFPTDEATLKQLLTEGDPFSGLNLGKRAIGTVMHLIQDSFARGHTRRWLRNPGDLLNSTKDAMTFKPNTFGDFGAVITFHSYLGQNADNHSEFDGDPTNDWYTTTSIDYEELDTYNSLVGARNAIDYCTQLLKFWHDGIEWDHGPRQLLETIFTLDGNATVSDVTVNEAIQLINLECYSTGLSSTNNHVDNHWSFIRNNSMHAAYVVQPNPAWTPSPLNTAWISPSSNTSADDGSLWTYRQKIQVPNNSVRESIAIVGRISVDDACQHIRVNGFQVTNAFSASSSPSFDKLVPFQLKGVFNEGDNLIEFDVENAVGPTGILVIIDGATSKKQ